MGNLLPLAVLTPLLGALATLFLPPRHRAAAGIIFSFATCAAVGLLGPLVAGGGSTYHLLGGWEPPLGIRLHLDGLAFLFLILTALVGLPVGLYAAAAQKMPDGKGGTSPLFWPLWMFLWAGMNGLYLSHDLFNLYVVMEIIGLAAVALAILSGRPAAMVAGLRYLLAALAGSGAFLFGVALFYGSYATLDLTLLGERVETSHTTAVAFALILVGLWIKAALFPLHFWLPPAHASADPPVSAILSALVVKTAFYLMLRLWTGSFASLTTMSAALALGILGGCAAVWGSYQALRQEHLKKMAAHSTVGQIGFLFIMLPLITAAPAGAAWLAPAWTAGIYQVLAHGFAKAAMFLSLGVFALATGHDRRDSMLNMVSRLPMATFAFALAGISLIGLPPSGGFVAKWMLLKAAFASGQWWWALIVVWASFLTAGYVFMVLRIAFAPAPVEPSEAARPVPKILEVAALALGIGAIAIGFRAEEIVGLLDIAPANAPAIELVEPPSDPSGPTDLPNPPDDPPDPPSPPGERSQP